MLNVVMPEKLPEKNPQIGKNFWKVAVKVDSLGIKKNCPPPPCGLELKLMLCYIKITRLAWCTCREKIRTDT